MKDFRELKVWQIGMELFEDVVIKDIEKFPNTEVAKIIANQIIRSVSSITANIAEGYGRRKSKEFEHYLHYLYIARGSTNETIDWYEKLKRIGHIDSKVFENREQKCQFIRAMLSKMINAKMINAIEK